MRAFARDIEHLDVEQSAPMSARLPRVVRSAPSDAVRLHWRRRLGVFALLISLIAQSLLTIGCGPDGLGSFPGDEVQVVAADAADSAAVEEYCSRCGGLRTATGCCAHGLPLTAAVVKVPRAFPAPSISAVDALPSPQRNPLTLFRPPIPA